MTVPAWIWPASAAGLIAVVVAEIVLTGRPGAGSFTARRAVSWVAVYVSLAVIFGLRHRITGRSVTAGPVFPRFFTPDNLRPGTLFLLFLYLDPLAVPPPPPPPAPLSAMSGARF